MALHDRTEEFLTDSSLNRRRLLLGAAAAVIYTLSRLVDQKVGAALRSRLQGSYDTNSLEAVADHTVKIHMLRRDTILDQPLSRYNTDCRFWIGCRNSAGLQDAGTGPFKVTKFEPGQSWEVGRFDGYWQPGLPYLDGI